MQMTANNEMSHAEQMAIYEALSRKKPCATDKIRNYLNPINFCYPKLKKLGLERKTALKLTKKYEVFFDALDDNVLTPLFKTEHSLRDSLSEGYIPQKPYASI
jgi:hypothetical protein